MRIGVIVAAAALGGCANTVELGNSFSMTVTAFSGGITASNQLEIDLQKDFSRKSEQLEYVSRGSYSCGNPRDPEIQRIEVGGRTGALRVQKDALKSLRTKNAYINAILGYGEVIEAYIKQQADLSAKLDKWSTALGTLSGLVNTPEVAAYTAIANSIIGDIKLLGQFVVHERIKQYAVRIGPHLAANVAHLVKTRHLRDLTAGEEHAYQLWSSCAKERLRFVQKYFPPTISMEATKPYPSIAPSPVWDFMMAYEQYITEREAFLGRKPDFAGLLEAIVNANNAIIEDKQDPLDAVNTMGSAAKSILDSASGIRKAAETI